MKNKNLLSCLLLLWVSITTYAYDACIDGIYYNLSGTTASVTYETTSYNNSYSGVIVIPNSIEYDGTNYSVTSIGSEAFQGCSALTSVTIPNSVTSIGDYAFNGCSGLTSVTIPNSVTSIGYLAFYSCTSLASISVESGNPVYDSRDNCNAIIKTSSNELVTGCMSTIIPNSVTSIVSYAFEGCSALTSVTIPNSVTSIGSYAFRNCSGLTSVTIPNSVTAIGTLAFANCSGLTSVTIPNSVKSIYPGVFAGCSGLTSVTLPNGITTIANGIFSGCSGLTSITIPSSVTKIDGWAFENCSGLAEIIIPSNVTSIGQCAFFGCSELTSLTIPKSVTSIGIQLVNCCSKLASISVESGNPVYDSRDNCNAIIKTSSNELVTGCMSTIIPNSVTSIGFSAFHCCSGLTSINIPSSVTSIGEWAFYICEGLTSVTIPNSVTSIGYQAFNHSGLKSVTIPNSLTSIDDVFSCCKSLTSVTIPNSVTSIGAGAFSWCSGLTSIDIPNSVTSIGSSAFYYCSSLTSVTIPNSVTSIGSGAFEGCSGLTSINIPNSVTSIGSSTFENCSGLTSINIPDSVTSIGSDAPSSVTSIGEFAFWGCSGLTLVKVDIKNPLSIKSTTFSNRTNATLYVPAGSKTAYEAANYWKNFKEIIEMEAPSSNITFADANVKAICVANWDTNSDGELSYEEAAAVTSLSNVFENNSQITSFDELQYFTGLTEIGNESFYWCRNLSSITIPENVEGIGTDAFNWCSSLADVEIPESVATIGQQAFRACWSFNNINIPNSVTNIGDGAFYECTKLSAVSIPASVTSIGERVFGYCSNLKSIFVAGNNEIYDSRNNCNAIIETSTNKLIAGCQNTVIPNSVTSIGSGAFYFCSGLTSVTIPESVTSIGSSAFYCCSSLTSVTVNWDTPLTIASNVFSNRANATLYVPFPTKSLYEAADYWKEFKEIVEDIEFTAGDVNSDNAVDVTDYMTIANYILGQAPTTFNEAAADVTQDSNVDVADYLGVANIILYGNYQGPQANSANAIKTLTTEQTSPWMGMEVTEDGLVELHLHDTPTFSAFQMDIFLPEGIEIYEANMSKAKQTRNLSYAQLQNGAWRLLYGTMDGKTVNLADHSLLTLKLTSKNKEAFGDIDVEGITLVRPNTSVMHLSGVHGTLPTGICDIESMMPAEANCYDLTGRKVTEGRLKKGVYIINGKKVLIK